MPTARLERAGSPKGVQRLLFRAPIGLYRIGLGFVFGKRFVMLEHTGRKSGETRRTVLEVVVNDPDAIYVAAGWGSQAQWLKNVKANPRVTVHLGSRKFSCVAELISKETANAVMSRYAADHPKTLDELAAFMLDDPGDSPVEHAARIAATIPMVRLSKTAG